MGIMDTNTASNDIDAAIISKIEALFRQANHPNTGEHERQAFHAKALALMEKHRIASVNLDVEADDQPADIEYGWCKGSYATANQSIISAVASLYGCRVYAYRSGRAGDPARLVFLFGFKRDAARVRHLAEAFMLDAKTQAAAYTSTGYGATDRTIGWRKSFMLGYAAEVHQRYAEAKRLLDAEQPGWASTGSALVLVSRARQVDEAFAAKKGMRTSRQSMRGFNPAGFDSGRVAARNSNVGRERLGGRNRAIGAGS